MTCNACGEKPKKTDREFTGPVIEINNPEQIVLLRKVVIPTSMGTEEQVPAAVGKYRNVILKYEANNHVYIYSSDGIPTLLEMDIPQEIWDSIEELQQEIDDLKNNPDVVDIVDTYADLQAYDTSDLGDKDVIRVLNDETHDGESAYYRWDKPNSQWVFIGAVDNYYTKEEVDTLLFADKGKPRELTEDDYDYPDESPDSVALWRLPSGLYHASQGVRNRFAVSSSVNDTGITVLVFKATDYTNFLWTAPLSPKVMWGYASNNGAIGISGVRIVTANQIINELNYTGDDGVLDARQGKVLNDKIDSTIGIAKTITTADLNWNSTTESATQPYDSVALYLLPPGLYIVPANITGFIGYNSDTQSWFQTDEKYLYMVTQRGPYGHMIIGWMADSTAGGSPFQMARVYKVSASLGRPNIITRAWIGAPIDNLDSVSTGIPLSANQGRRIKNMIGDLDSLVTQDKQSLVAALNQFIVCSGYRLTYPLDTLTVWVDDEPIQKITKKVASLPNNSTQVFSLGLDNVKDVVKIEIVAHDQANNIFKPIPDGAGASAELTSAGMKITTTADYSGYSAAITVYYTEQSS